MLILSGINDYDGGTAVSAGTLEFTTASALPPGSRLTVGADAKAIFPGLAQVRPVADATQAVPEPLTLALLGAGVILLGVIGLIASAL